MILEIVIAIMIGWLALAFVFGKLWGLNAVWFAYPCAELIVCCIYVPICIKEVKTKFNRGN